MLPAEVCSIKRAAEGLNKLGIEHKDIDKLTHAKGMLALKNFSSLILGYFMAMYW